MKAEEYKIHYTDYPCKNLGRLPRFSNDKDKITCVSCLKRFNFREKNIGKPCCCCGQIIGEKNG